MTLFPFFPYEHTDGGECGARFINGVPCNARRRGEKPPPARRAKWRDERIGRVPPSSRKILLSAQKNFREFLLLLYHFPAPLGKPFAADFSLLFKGERACSRKGGRARRQQRAAARRRQQPRTRMRGGGIFDECRKIFSFLLHFFIKSLDYGGFLWYDEKKGAFLHIPVRKRLFEGETQCNMRS